MPRIIVLTIFFFLFFPSRGQDEYIFEHIRDGLPHYIVHDISQDDFGFIWMSCGNDLVKYDGYHVKTYQIIGEKGLNASSRNIVPVSGGSVLFIGNNFISQYLPKFDSFEVFMNDSHLLQGEQYTKAFYDSSSIWIGTNQGRILNVDIHSKKIKSIHLSDKKAIVISFIYREDKLRILTSKGIYVLQNDKIVDSILLSNGKSMCFDEDDNILIGTSSGLFLYNAKKRMLNKSPLIQGDIMGITKIKNKEYWLKIKNSGICIYRGANVVPQYLKYSQDNSNGLSSNIVNAIYKDKSDVVWIATPYYVNKTDLHRKPFYNLVKKPVSSVSTKGYASIIEDKHGLIWYITIDGTIGIVEAKTNRAIKIVNQPIYSNSGLSFSEIKEDMYGYIWVMSWHGGILKIYPPTLPLADNIYINYVGYNRYKDTTALNAWSYRSLFIDKKSEVYLGAISNNGIERYNRTTFKFDQIKSPPFNIWTIRDDNADNLLVGTADSGFYIFNKRSAEVKRYVHDPLNSNSISCNNVRSVFFDSDGTIWIGTLMGLNRLDIKENTIQRYFVEDGLPNNSIVSILEDNSRKLWIGTDMGLSCYNITNKEFKNYFISDGIMSNQFSYNGFYKNKEGFLYLSGIDGITRFHPDSILDNPCLPQCVIQNIKVNNRSIRPGLKIKGHLFLEESPITASRVILSWSDRDIEFEIAVLHFANPSANRIKYKLKGYDGEWKETVKGSRIISYTNLLPGRYTFMVIASNNDGIWNEVAREIDIIIKPPFWQSVWFKLLFPVFLLMVIIFLIARILLNAEKKREKLEEMVAEKTLALHDKTIQLENVNNDLIHKNEDLKTLSEELKTQSEELMLNNETLIKLNTTKDKLFAIISHDLKNPFQAITAYTELLSNKYNLLSEEEIQKHIHSLDVSAHSASELLENLFEWGRAQSKSIIVQSQIIHVDALIKSILPLVQLNADKKNILIKNEVQDFAKCYADKNMLATILRNLISNAIKFSPEKALITIASSVDNPYLKISVSDKGIGMDAEMLRTLFRLDKQKLQMGTTGESGTGLGLVICKDFVEKMNGDISVNSQPNKGTTFSVFIPLSENAVDTVSSVNEIEHKLNEAAAEGNTVLNGNEEKKYVLLIVDDQKEVRSSLVNSLSYQFEIHEAENGVQGIETAIDIIPDVIISDVMMPEKDGFELCYLLRNDERTSHIPIILLTAGNDDSKRIQGIEVGADDYIAKPFNIHVLESRIKNLIRNRALLQRRYGAEINLSPQSVSSNKTDERFTQRISELMEKNLANENYNVDAFASDMNMSRRQLYRKFDGMFGMSVNEFINDFRLKRAALMLSSHSMNVSEVANNTGFTNLSYFSNVFHKKFGMTPSGFAEKQRKS